MPLQYMTLVLFNGHNRDRSYMTFDLDQYKTNERGYFIIGSDRVRGDGKLIYSYSIFHSGIFLLLFDNIHYLKKKHECSYTRHA